jgi:hypothetical protein
MLYRVKGGGVPFGVSVKAGTSRSVIPAKAGTSGFVIPAKAGTSGFVIPAKACASGFVIPAKAGIHVIDLSMKRQQEASRQQMDSRFRGNDDGYSDSRRPLSRG